ncbi:MAG: hypothetical protein JKY65_04730 [Planctomycetes bacterium]|nr:hypothetical protein [Planctomycetota bacterium]
MALRGDLGLTGVPLLVRYLARERGDAHLELEQGQAQFSLDLVGGVLHCLPPASSDRRTGAISGRVLDQLVQRGAALREEVSPQASPLRDLLTRRGLGRDERRASIQDLLTGVLGANAGTFELNFRAPHARLQRAIEGGKTIAFQVPELLREASKRKPTIRLTTPGPSRGVEGAGEGWRVFLEVATVRRLNGTFTVLRGSLRHELLLVDGVAHAGATPLPDRAALCALLAWGGGGFGFVPRRSKTPGPALEGGLLEELAAQAASWSSLLSLVSGPSAVFAFTSVAAESESSQVFGLDLVGEINGKRSLRELADNSPQAVLEVVRTIADLVTLGFVQRVL